MNTALSVPECPVMKLSVPRNVVVLHADCKVQGIILAGGVVQDATLAKQTAATVRAVFAPKVGP